MITLVLGGARSGKSEYAEKLASAAESLGRAVVYVATAAVRGDPDFDERVARHQRRRPASWATEEPGADLIGFLAGERSGATLLIDSLGAWLTSAEDFVVDAAGLCAALAARPGGAIIVSEEVGLGVHPSTAVGGRFRDALGQLNRAVAEQADQVVLIVAGRVLPLGAAI